METDREKRKWNGSGQVKEDIESGGGKEFVIWNGAVLGWAG